MSVPYDETVLTSKTAEPARQDGRPAARAALGAACISSSAILVTLAHAGPATTAFYRCVLALPVLVPLAVAEQRRRGARSRENRLYALLAGLFLAVDLVLWNHAIADVGAGVATVLGNLQVLFVGVLAWLVLKERPNRRFLTMLPVVFVGVVLVSGAVGGSTAGLAPTAGIGFGLAPSAAYAVFLLTMRQKAGSGGHGAGQLADATAGAAAGSLLLGLAFGGFQFRLAPASLGWLLMLALLSQTAGWLLITSSLPQLPAALSSLLLLLQPAAAMVLADIILGQRPTLLQVAGALLVCGGVLAVAWVRSGRHREQDVAVAEPGGDGMAAQPRVGYRDGELDAQHGGEVCV